MATRVIVKKANSKSLASEVTEFILPIATKHLQKAGQLTVNTMKSQISASIRRPGSTGNLENAIFAETISALSIGIGNIDYLNATVPYWYWINYGIAQTGRRVPPGTDENSRIRGSFSPGEAKPNDNSFRAGRFVKGGFPMNPKKPIDAHNYIERTVVHLSEIAERATQ